MATFTGSELLEVAGHVPAIGCVVANRWIVVVDGGDIGGAGPLPDTGTFAVMRSEEHTSELQSP
jgi:hypothetical protein